MSKHLTILVVEDEEIMLTALEFRMRKHGFNVVLARDGQQAINYLASNTPDAIVTDMMMPNVTGMELLEYVRQNLDPTYASPMPVIIISALEQDDVVLDAFKAGANDFIAKPFKPQELILRLRRFLEGDE